MKNLRCISVCIGLLGLGSSTIALAQDDGGTAAVGPDVIVSTIADFTNYGGVGGITGYAVTTVSCNIGDTNAIWIDCSSGRDCNQHPVIGQNLYRLKTQNGSTRFEQLGQSWLKHAFCGADASGPNCLATCNNDGTCDSLGVGCTDTYGAGLNTAQPSLGPKSEVNAYTGNYVYPYVRAWQQSGNAIFKRLQVHNVDVDPAQNPGADSTAANAATKLFGEVVYIVTDEAPARRFNNYTYMRARSSALSGGAVPITFIGNTFPQHAAIDAWPANDPGASLAQINVSGEGRFVLGYKVTSLGNGIWHYEYAVFNMNSDRSGQSFSIAAPDWLSYSNMEFHDVDYHSGEPFVGTDWPAVKNPGTMTWSSETFAANANANAIRWGTMYNFRVDVNAPPVMGNVTLGLFKPGTPTSVTVQALVPAPIGDMNCDHSLNNFDIEPFVLAVTDAAAYGVAYPGCPITMGDINGDSSLNNFDIDAFIGLILH